MHRVDAPAGGVINRDVRLTRRRAIELAGAATALAALRPASAAAFGMDLPLDGRVVRAPQRFDLVGLDFGPAAHVHAELRARRRGGPWTAWAHVHDATQPVWTGPADELQVRHRGSARELRARFVRVEQGARPLVSARPSAKGRAPQMFMREDWGGDRLKRKAPPEYGAVQVAFVHHTVTANTYGPEDSAGIVLGIARYHRDHNGWNDIGYNFLVDRYGQIFEGREGGIDLAVMGAQAQGYNSHSTGVSCIGDFTSTRLPAAGVDALARLLAWKLAVHGVPPTGTTLVESEGGSANRYREGTMVRLARISGHLDGNATACPGGALYDQLGAIRRRTAEMGGRGVSAITLRADSTELVYPDTVVSVAGTLRFPGKTSPAAATVQLQFQPHAETGAAATYEVLQEVVTNEEGYFAAEVTVPGSGNLQALFPGDGTRPAVSGTPIVIAVRPYLELTVSPRQVRAGTRATLSGFVEPAGATWGKLAVHRRVGARAYRVESRRVAVVDGVVDTGFRPPEPGLYRVTLRINGARVRRHLRAF